MNRTAVLPIALATVVGLAACGSSGQTTTTTDVPPATQAQRAAATPPAESPAAAPSAPASDGTRITGTGYSVTVSGSGWSDLRAQVPAGSPAFDEIWAQPSPQGGRRILQIMRTRVGITNPSGAEGFPAVLRGMRGEAKGQGMTLGTPSASSLGGERAMVVPATAKAPDGRRFDASFLVAFHGGVGYSVAIISPRHDRARVAAEFRTIRRTWRWSDQPAASPGAEAPDTTTPHDTPETGVPAWRPGVRRA